MSNTYSEEETQASFIYDILLSKGPAKTEAIAEQCKISKELSLKCLELLQEQGLVKRTAHGMWSLPEQTEQHLSLDATPYSEDSLCSAMQNHKIRDEKTDIKEVVNDRSHGTEVKRVNKVQSHHAHKTEVKEVTNERSYDTKPKEMTHDRSHSPLSRSLFSTSKEGTMSGVETSTKTPYNSRFDSTPRERTIREEASMKTPCNSRLDSTPRERTIRGGSAAVSTNAPVVSHSSSIPDPGLQPYYLQLLKIIEVLKGAKEPLKPHEVAKTVGIGSTKKDCNAYLYALQKKKIAYLRCKENKGNPLWSTGENINSYTETDLLECAAEVSKGKCKIQTTEGVPGGDTHIHNHYHQHNTYIQAGTDNKMLVVEGATGSTPSSGSKSLPYLKQGYK